MFTKGNLYGRKGKRGKGKIDVELKDQLKNITKEILDSINTTPGFMYPEKWAVLIGPEGGFSETETKEILTISSTNNIS